MAPLNLLLDTHILLWSLGDPDRLSARQRAAIESPDNAVWISAISLWEMVIKSQVGKLRIPERFVARLEDRGFKILSFSAEDGLDILNLPLLHTDPFDRALMAQARVNRLFFVSADRLIRQYHDFVDFVAD